MQSTHPASKMSELNLTAFSRSYSISPSSQSTGLVRSPKRSQRGVCSLVPEVKRRLCYPPSQDRHSRRRKNPSLTEDARNTVSGKVNSVCASGVGSRAEPGRGRRAGAAFPPENLHGRPERPGSVPTAPADPGRLGRQARGNSGQGLRGPLPAR